jgi:hypothetical protein
MQSAVVNKMTVGPLSRTAGEGAERSEPGEGKTYLSSQTSSIRQPL